jgi:hypothetical protein
MRNITAEAKRRRVATRVVLCLPVRELAADFAVVPVAFVEINQSISCVIF